jgi:uncharacterized LabA/DUF88 family protein
MSAHHLVHRDLANNNSVSIGPILPRPRIVYFTARSRLLSTNMNEVIYFFIDGGYVRQKYADAMNRVFSVAAAEPEMSNLQLWCYGQRFGKAVAQRFFYYDCLHDSKKDGETVEEFAGRVERQNATFEKIQSLPGFHIRLGSLSGLGKKVRQKKVDVLLAVEMLDHAFRKNMAAAFLLAGDGDFTPVVEAVTRLGTWVQVHYDRHGASKELFSSADWGRSLSFNDLWSWGSSEFKEGHPVPTQLPPVHFDVSRFSPTKAKTGKNENGERVTLGERGDKAGEFFVYVERTTGTGATVFVHHNFDVLERYYREFESASWDKP